MLDREALIQSYLDHRKAIGRVPEHREFLRHSGCSRRDLDRVFGAQSYAKLQVAAGDTPNRLNLQRTPIDTIMRQYGGLVRDLQMTPVSAEWTHRGFKPTESGLAKGPHKIKWSEFPTRFVEWAEATNDSEFADAVTIVKKASATAPEPRDTDATFGLLMKDVRNWSPARRRGVEETYKVELRKHLESLGHRLAEEAGDSHCDLVVGNGYAIELKKDPSLAEYDRLFGQIARHLEHQRRVIALVIDTKEDAFSAFAKLVDRYFNREIHLVEVMKKG